MWGSELSLLWEKLCCIIIFQLWVTFPVDVGFGDGGVRVQWPRPAPGRVGAAVGPCSESPSGPCTPGQQGRDWHLLWVA